ncbi:hypothetical protein J437_LFUL010687 [Ladona fulva]|uniref:Uncharacterized protein n=1 Tax=Ladona fulva TaxID=123851 RepID=A0A8K0K9W0_LADFU|nr:hypothetical protein J437_LFUL010687 [Ladona fulva]
MRFPDTLYNDESERGKLLLAIETGKDSNLFTNVPSFYTHQVPLRRLISLFSRSPKYIIKESKASYKVYMSLTIRGFGRSDIGTYNCVSTNSLGRAEGTLRLYGKHFQWRPWTRLESGRR